MPIEVRNDMNPQSYLMGAAGAGQTTRQNQLIDEERNFRRKEDLMGQQTQNRKDLMDYQQGLSQQDFEFKLSTQQKNDYDKLQTALDNMRSSGLFTPEEIEQGKREILEKQSGITPSLRPRKSPWEKGKGVGDTWRGDGGMLFTRGKDGTVKKIGDNPDAPNADIWKQALEASKGADPTVPPDMKKAREYYNMMMGKTGNDGTVVNDPVNQAADQLLGPGVAPVAPGEEDILDFAQGKALPGQQQANQQNMKENTLKDANAVVDDREEKMITNGIDPVTKKSFLKDGKTPQQLQKELEIKKISLENYQKEYIDNIKAGGATAIWTGLKTPIKDAKVKSAEKEIAAIQRNLELAQSKILLFKHKRSSL